ncbi:hypothetical protein ACWCPM_34505 [Streptomyces sp. NPDC002309]
MALNKRGSRRITVDGTEYRWRIRRKPSYSQDLCWTPLTYAVEVAADRPGRVLVVTADQPHPGNWLGVESEPIRPADVVASIWEARLQGWEPTHAGPPYLLERDQDGAFLRDH